MRPFLAASVLALSATVAQASSVTLDFEAAPLEPIAEGTSIVEDGFEIAVLSGTTFAVGLIGNPGAALVIGFEVAPDVGDTLEITRFDGGLFNVTEFDYGSFTNDPSDVIDITGLRGTTQTGALTSFSSSTRAYATQSG